MNLEDTIFHSTNTVGVPTICQPLFWLLGDHKMNEAEIPLFRNSRTVIFTKGYPKQSVGVCVAEKY